MKELITLVETGRFSEALGEAEKIRETFDQTPSFHNLTGLCRQSLGQPGLAMDCFRQALALDAGCVEALNNLGALLAERGKIGEASALFDRALAIQPDFADALNNLGNASRQLGQLDKAIASYESAIRYRPEAYEIILNLSQIKDWRRSDPMIKGLEQRLALESLSTEQRSLLLLSLANIYFRLDETTAAMAALHEGNRLQKRRLGYDLARDRMLFSQLIKRFEPVDFSVSPIHPDDGETGIRPLFITGLPRSGTTLTEQMLSAHSEITGAGELPFLTRGIVAAERESPGLDTRTLLNIREQYFRRVAELEIDTPRFTDKMPLNFRWLGYIRLCFPEARVIHLQRDPRAVAWSLYRNYFTGAGNGFSYSYEDIVGYMQLHDDLMNFWETKLGNTVFFLRYEALVDKPRDTVAAMLDYLGLPFESACLEFHTNPRAVNTASALDIRKPLSASRNEQWRAYREFIEPLIRMTGQSG